jgi:hypothetical protein
MDGAASLHESACRLPSVKAEQFQRGGAASLLVPSVDMAPVKTEHVLRERGSRGAHANVMAHPVDELHDAGQRSLAESQSGGARLDSRHAPAYVPRRSASADDTQHVHENKLVLYDPRQLVTPRRTADSPSSLRAQSYVPGGVLPSVGGSRRAVLRHAPQSVSSFISS